MPTITVPVSNPNLGSGFFELQSVTERRDLPRKFECLPDNEGDGLSSTNTNYSCQNGCGNERPFMWIVDEGDTIRLQFQAEDLLNDDPTRPEFGWYEGPGDHFVRLAVLDTAGVVVWEGDINSVSTDFHVGFSSFGAYQNVAVDVDRLLEVLPEGTTCWSFRVAVVSYMGSINSVNDDHAFSGSAPVGFSYIDFADTLQILEWTGAAYEQIGPNAVDEVWYVANTGAWYRWTGTEWVSAPAGHEGEEPEEDFLFTMGYRLRKCNEKVVEFASTTTGRDCAGFIHVIARANGGEVNNADFLGYWDMGTTAPPYTEPFTIVLNQFDGKVYQLIAGVWTEQAAPDDGSLWLMANEQGFVFSGPEPVQIVAVAEGTFLRFSAASGYNRWTNIQAEQAPALSAFQWSFKVAGSVEVESLPVERELTENGVVLSLTSQRVAKLRTVGLPESVVLILQAVVASKDFTINGEAWKEVGAFGKNNDRGALWWINSQLSRDDCKTEPEC